MWNPLDGAQSPAAVANIRNPEIIASANPVQAHGKSVSASSPTFRFCAATPIMRKSTTAIDPMNQNIIK